jgi:hemoglobin
MASLYERLGGMDAITAVVDSFDDRCLADDRINRKFERTDIPRLRTMLID